MSVADAILAAKIAGKGGGGGTTGAVRYDEKQTLTDAQQKQARDNIDAASSDFVINGTLSKSSTDITVTLDKTFAQIQGAITAGKTPILNINGVYFQLAAIRDDNIAFSNAQGEKSVADVLVVYVYPDQEPQVEMLEMPALDTDGNMPQVSMAAAPTTDMQIATKKYVDDITVVDEALDAASKNPVQNKAVKAALDGKASTAVATTTSNGLMSAADKVKLDGLSSGTDVILQSSTAGSSKKFKITVDDTGTLTAMEVTT